MTLESQVCSLDLAKRLKELGVKQESYFEYYKGIGGGMYLGDTAESMNNAIFLGNTTAPQFERYSAFTVAELGELLPDDYIVIKEKDKWEAWKLLRPNYELETLHPLQIELENEADARAEMLIYLLENKLISV